MSHKHPAQISLVAAPQASPNERLDNVLATLDDLHTAASEGNLAGFTGMDEREMLNWLREVVYTAQETIAEVQATHQSSHSQPLLHIVEKIGKAG